MSDINPEGGLKMFTHKLKKMFLFLLGILLLPTASIAAEPLVCDDYTFEVNLSPDDPAVYNVVGTLCSRGSLEGKTVQLLVSGLHIHGYTGTFPSSQITIPMSGLLQKEDMSLLILKGSVLG